MMIVASPESTLSTYSTVKSSPSINSSPSTTIVTVGVCSSPSYSTVSSDNVISALSRLNVFASIVNVPDT